MAHEQQLVPTFLEVGRKQWEDKFLRIGRVAKAAAVILKKFKYDTKTQIVEKTANFKFSQT